MNWVCAHCNRANYGDRPCSLCGDAKPLTPVDTNRARVLGTISLARDIEIEGEKSSSDS